MGLTVNEADSVLEITETSDVLEVVGVSEPVLELVQTPTEHIVVEVLKGLPGDAGTVEGPEGDSAYEVAVANGFVGDEATWLASLEGPQGPQGVPGEPGPKGDTGDQGPQGLPGVDGEDGAPGPKGDTGDIGPAGPKGDTGDVGPQGLPGDDGAPGADGDSAYEIAVSLGFTGTEAEWVSSLEGPQGPQGIQGDPGPKGDTGDAGPQGIPGTPGADGEDGAPGADGDSAYEVAVANGFVGTEADWIASLEGPQGPQGIPGEPGPKGDTGDTGPQGNPGTPGAEGDSAYQVALANGFVGTETEWLASLEGPQGEPGIKGDTGDQGPQGLPGVDGEDGATGATGPGVSAGGATGTFLVKNSGTDYDTSWSDLPVTSTSINSIVQLTQAAYDGLTPDANTLYVIVG